ncbi:site-specific integrase [Mameliella sp. AT18]|uniref:site-specific integrase n=1 Tax=Mameliella sp. AT18 TaxID=3028385 RepID=UPI000840FFCC|nr:site-specific integrase [Mameliella sp. AT18]MDD9732216.1 site-specific integrase [Mameliella sp. AT18]ODM49109.1 hypothetical protein A9320_17750 [Ruegeria sp. PBVC088]
MRLAAYLCTSRHGIFYFRFPLPPRLHPAQQRTHLKVSLKTRQPEEARQLSRLLALAGQSLLAQPNLPSMRYDEIRGHVREHFGQMLRDFRDRSADSGPATGMALDALRAGLALSESATADWAPLTHKDGADGLLRAFCAARGIAPEPEGRARSLLLAELQKGYREYVARAVEHTAEFDTLTIEQAPASAPAERETRVAHNTVEPDALPLADVLSRYFDEIDRTGALATKTRGEKQDALALMAELTGDKPPAHMKKVDAQQVKDALFKLPKNRSKNPKTRDLPLSEALELPGVQRISARTMNVYLGNMQHFFGWAVNNGYASDNLFHGMRIKPKAKGGGEGREAFSADQLRLMFLHLTDPDSALVRKEVHKWPALIGMFTGMRLNEVAQLEVRDIELQGDVWCINVTPDGEGNKRLKNASSKRRVPVHDRLKACGFLDFYEAQKAAGHSRLFPGLTYTAQNGYGRNAGRWFNDRFLAELGLDRQGLTYHCLRHTMVTRLAQTDVEEPVIKALVGHSQTGVTLGTYFQAGYLPSQLRDAINRFDF